MSETQIQTIKDVIKMLPRLNAECLNSIKFLIEQSHERIIEDRFINKISKNV